MKILQIPGEMNALVDELRVIRKRASKDKKRQSQIVGSLTELTEQSPATLYFNKLIVAMIEAHTANRIDADKLRALYPQIADECTVPVDFLTVKCC